MFVGLVMLTVLGGGHINHDLQDPPPTNFSVPPKFFGEACPPKSPLFTTMFVPPIPPVEVPISALNCAAQQKFGNFEPENAKVIAGGNSFLPLVP